MKNSRELPHGARQYFSADNRSPRSFPPNVFQVGRNGFLPLQRSVLFDTAECGIFFPNESGTVEVFYAFTS